MTLQEELQARIRQLEQLGYQEYQIQQLMEEAIGTMQWERVSPVTQQELVEYLESQIDFAIRCRKMK